MKTLLLAADEAAGGYDLLDHGPVARPPGRGCRRRRHSIQVNPKKG